MADRLRVGLARLRRLALRARGQHERGGEDGRKTARVGQARATHATAHGKPMSLLASPLRLPCGVALPNRLAKAAMTEGLADRHNRATEAHARLYRRWAGGGAGLLITGNVQICRRHLERAGNIALDGAPDALGTIRLGQMARAACALGAVAVVQLSHAGRQTPAAINPRPQAASAVPVALPGRQFGFPVEMPDSAVDALAGRFAAAARACQEAGFSGVQLHAAHGYLLSGFLSPLANRRRDRWGGSLANRARPLLGAVRAVRAACGPGFLVSVKLNSADFQRGGFDIADSCAVAAMLEAEGIDLLEVSGGNYEAPRMVGLGGLEPAGPADRPQDPEARTAAREAYFLAEAARLRAATRVPLMLTGGFRTGAAMEAALGEGVCDVIGLARPLVVAPDAPARLLADPSCRLPAAEPSAAFGPGPFGRHSRWPVARMLNGVATQAWFYQQILRLAEGLEPDFGLPLWRALVRHQAREVRMIRALA